MLANLSHSTARVIAPAMIMASLVAAASLAFAGAASAQTGFQASVSAVTPKPQPCPNNEYLCGTAITNYGPADWAFTPSSFTPTSNACGVYQATVTFELGDGSTLALDENGTACQPGNALSAPGAMKSYGNPFTITGSWIVRNASGQFESITGTGTDILKAAGAQVSGTYTQTA